jgi:hypothetical protein
MQVVPQLLQMSESRAFGCPDTPLALCAAELQTTTEALLLQQLEYLAAVRQQLSPAVQSRCRNQFRLLSSTGQLLPSSQLHIAPADPAALQLLQDLARSGYGLPLLHDAFTSFAADEEKRLTLKSLFGVQQADAAAVIKAIADAHSKLVPISITEQQRMQHLMHMATQLDLLESAAGSVLLQQVRQAVQLLQAVQQQDAAWRCCTAGQLHLPLGQQFVGLQEDMDAAGMKFLHSSYIAAESVTGSAAGSSCVAQRRLQQLLQLLGVKTADDDAVVRHILQLYCNASSSSSSMLTVQQHMGHVRFICSRWLALSLVTKETVKQQLVLLLHSADDAAGSGGSDGSSQSAASGVDNSNSSFGAISCVYAPASQLLELPAAGSAEQQLLGKGGAQFLHGQYAAAEPDRQGLLLWMRSHLGVQPLTRSTAVDCILQAQEVARVGVIPTQQLVEEALYVALHGSPEQHERAASELLLVKVAPNGKPAIRMKVVGLPGLPCYYPEAGDGWQLQQVLLPSEVAYLHPAYVVKVDQLSSSADTRSSGVAFKRFLTQQLGVLALPQPASVDLLRTVVVHNGWLPLLLLLRERWLDLSMQEQQQLLQSLKNMRVDSSSGPRCLQNCFLQSAVLQGSLQQLLQQLQLPFLQVPDPSSYKWLFLQSLGVSTQLRWPDLQKALQQLSSSNAAPELDTTRELYRRVHALCDLDAAGFTARKVRHAFEQQLLLFVPHQEGRRSSRVLDSAGHQWLHSSDVLWSGSRRSFATKVFISWEYKVSSLLLLLLSCSICWVMCCEGAALVPCHLPFWELC